MGRFKILAAALGLATIGAAVAQTARAPLSPVAEINVAPSPTAPTQHPKPGTPELTAQDVNAWLDGFMPIAIGKSNIPGAVVVVVKDGQILTSRGYGFSNVEERTPVNPATTMFRPGSVSKLFTWTAVMQQVEQGKLNLDEDVNKYLDFKIPPRNGKPITLRQIMTHTAGFEEAIKDIIFLDEKNVRPLDETLKRWVPNRVYDPGSTPAYSNYATALAGYIVSRVSGQSFDDYVERNIFAPLGMRHSTFRQPLPAKFKRFVAEGYQPGSDEPYGYEYIGPGPAGSLASSGDDMGRFMIAHLAKGAPLLRPQTAELMHATANTPIPGLQSHSLGFYQSNLNGRPVISHGGDTVAFHSDLQLFKDDGIGIFVSFNSVGNDAAAGDLRSALLDQFADRYFPAPADARKLDAKAARENAEKLAGTWTTSRRSHSSFLGVTDFIGQTKISVGEDGNPVIAGLKGLNGQPHKWVAVGPMLWRDANSNEMLGAQVVDGKAVRWSIGSIAPIIVWDRTPWYRDSAWLLPLMYLSLAVLLLTALFWPVRALVRRRYGAKLELERRELLAYRGSRIAATAILATLIAWTVMIIMMFDNLTLLSSSAVPLIITLQLLSLVVFVGGAAAVVWYAWTVWRRAGGWKASWKAKVWSLLLVISALTVLWIAVLYRLIGFSTNF